MSKPPSKPPSRQPPAPPRGSDQVGQTANAVAFRVDAALAGFRLDQFLQRMIPRLSRSRIQKAIGERIRLSWGASPRAATPVRAGGIVYLERPPQADEEPIHFNPVVLFEDEHLLAIDKPPGVVVHPTQGHTQYTVITMLRTQRDEPKLTLGHRLDAETSGVLLLARTRAAAAKLQRRFENGPIEKEYSALVYGNPNDDAFVVDRPLGMVTADNFVFRQGPDGAHAKPARTEFRVLHRGARFSLVRAKLISGRRHQIRAHLALTGHPIVGDKLYALEDRVLRAYLRDQKLDDEHKRFLVADRTMLHSALLAMPHPCVSRQSLRIEAPLPEDMQQLIDTMGHADG